MKNIHITIISPVYKANDLIEKLVNQITENVKKITNSYEIILVEDGSPDNSWTIIEKICNVDLNVKGIKLSRNFGQHYAITAGLEKAEGEWIVVMDCDLQDRPDQILKLYNTAIRGYDIVFAKRILRNDSFLKKMSSYLFYKLFSYLTDTKQDRSVANFGIFNRKVIKAILSMKDYVRYFPTMSQWVGFKKTYIEVEHGKRDEGKSSYTIKRLIELAFNNIIAFSDKPLRLTIKLGVLIALTSAIIGIYYLLSYLLGNIVVIGFASLIISIWFLSGIIIIILGVIGIYLGKVFDEVKDRPTYIVDSKINFDE